jgi:hypothetical protein
LEFEDAIHMGEHPLGGVKADLISCAGENFAQS